MRGITRHIAILVIALAGLCGSTPGLAAGTLEGRWELVEQHYGEGRANQAPREEPVWLEFSHDGEKLNASIWVGTSRAQAVPWPALAGDEAQLTVRVEESSASPLLDRIRAVYTVEPAPGDSTVLEVVEVYQLADPLGAPQSEGKCL